VDGGRFLRGHPHAVGALLGVAGMASNSVLLGVRSDPPVALHLLTPNGGEFLTVGGTAHIRWEVGDTVAAPIVALEVQRAPSLPWEPIDGAAPNNGHRLGRDGSRHESLARIYCARALSRSGTSAGNCRAILPTRHSGSPRRPCWPRTVSGAMRVHARSTATVPDAGTDHVRVLAAPRRSVRLSIVDLMGRESACSPTGRIARGSTRRAGTRKRRNPLPSGVYFLRHADSVGNAVRRLTMLR